jgi:hypothetical protein
MTTGASKRREPWQEVIEEFAGDKPGASSLQRHLVGCLAAYQFLAKNRGKAEIGDACYFAFEAIWGIVNAETRKAQSGRASASGPEWILPPQTLVGVPWIWLAALAEAWEWSDHGEKSVGIALGLEGAAGKRRKSSEAILLLNRRAIAYWINARANELRAKRIRNPIQSAKADAANRLGMGHDTIRSSRLRMVWLRADWETPSFDAAFVKLRSRAAAAKANRSSRCPHCINQSRS